MKKLITPLSFALLCVLNSSAQKETKKFSAGFGLEAGAPAGNITNAYNFAVGLTVRFSYHVGAGFATLTTGTIGYAPKKVEGEPE
jgi:hypothetical protein